MGWLVLPWVVLRIWCITASRSKFQTQSSTSFLHFRCWNSSVSSGGIIYGAVEYDYRMTIHVSLIVSHMFQPFQWLCIHFCPLCKSLNCTVQNEVSVKCIFPPEGLLSLSGSRLLNPGTVHSGVDYYAFMHKHKQLHSVKKRYYIWCK